MFSISATCRILVVGDLADDHRRLEQPRNLGGTPAALAGDDLVAVTSDPADQNRLNDPVRPDRLRQLFERPLLDLSSRLARVGDDSIEIDLEGDATDWLRTRCGNGRRDRGLRRQLRDQGAQAATERWTLFCHDKPLSVSEMALIL